MTDQNYDPAYQSCGKEVLVPNFFGQEKTSETSITSTVSNQEFLSAIFGEDDSSARPVVVSFSGNPSSSAGANWHGNVWYANENGLLQDESNNYFSLATFIPNDVGVHRRQKRYFSRLYALMLDDVGTKVSPDAISLPPTWAIETSPGNHQVGYVFDEPLAVTALADKLMKAIITAGLSDPGATGPTTRLARLPVGCNGKHAPAFVCRLKDWHPERRYTFEQLMSAYAAKEVEPRSVSKAKSAKVAESRDHEQMKVWVPVSPTNRIIDRLQTLGLYKKPLDEGKHEIRCPWTSEHTGGVDSGAAYFAPTNAYPAGGFKCLHGHCTDRRLNDLLKHLGLELADARLVPTIRVVPGELNVILDAAERVLAQSQRYFHRGGLLVAVLRDPSRSDVRIQEISEADLLKELATSIAWERLDGQSDKLVVIDPPMRYVATLFKTTSFRHLPTLLGIAHQPYLGADGSLIFEPGYHSSSMMFGAFAPAVFAIPEQPTPSDVKAAMSLLESLLEEFAFQNEVDKAAALSAILTAAIRPSLPLAPAFHIRAHAAGSGKSYLCELIAIFATEQPNAPAAFPSDNDECRKFLLAELLRGPAVITFDNLTTDLLAHRSLCTALTSEYLSDRVLGISKTAIVSTRTLFLSSGNNTGAVKDMTRRTVTINLDPGCESPATRSFKRPNLIREVREDRAKYVSAALTVILAHIQSDEPKQATMNLAGFKNWTDWCVAPLLRLGYSDPVCAVAAAIAEDPDRELLGRFLDIWHEQFGSKPTMVREVVEKAELAHESYVDLKEVIQEIAWDRGGINRRKLGWWIKRHEGQVVGGKRFQRSSSGGSAEKWRVEVLEVLPVSSGSSGKITTNDGADYRRMSRGG